jgi:transmembrane sensor
MSIDRGGTTRSVEAQAHAWIVRLEEEPGAEPECDAWRAEDEAHDQAFREASRYWSMAPALGGIIGDDWRKEVEELERSPIRRARDWAVRGTGRIALPLAMAASLALVIVAPQLVQPAPMEIATKIAQTRLVGLNDGSRVTVGARSDVQIRYSEKRREVTLASGQAFFEVAHDPARPFIVLAGNAEIRVTGTKFDVRRVGDDVQVSVLEGRVELRRRPLVAALREAEPARVLAAGEGSVLDEGRSFTPEAPTPGPPGEWRSGRLYYSEAPIAEIVADLQRYSDVPIRIADADVGRMKVTTSFRSNEVDRFVDNLEVTMPVESARGKDGSITLRKR